MTTGFTIKLDTARASIAEKLKAFTAGPDTQDKDGKPIPADQTHIESVKLEILNRIAALPEQFDGILLIANGTQDLDAGRSIHEIQIYGKTGHI